MSCSCRGVVVPELASVSDMNESRIAQLRRSKGWTQQQLASESGVTVRTVQRLEAGQDSSMDTLSRIAKALEVPVGDLFSVVEKQEFGEAVEGLELRTARQQEQRDSYTKGIMLIYRGVGLVVTFGTVVFAMTANLGWYPWLIIPAYWGGGRLALEALFRLKLDPMLNEKYPLSVARDEEK